MSEDAQVALGQKEPIKVTINGREVTVREIRAKNVPIVLPLLERLYKFIAVMKDTPEDERPALLVPFAEEMPYVIKMAAVLSEVPEEEVGNLGVDELMDLAAACVRVNLTFFIQRFLPYALQAVAVTKGSAALAPTSGSAR